MDKFWTLFKCLLGIHGTVVMTRATGEFVRPAKWVGQCGSCGKVFVHEVEEPPMIAESERIQLHQGDEFDVE